MTLPWMGCLSSCFLDSSLVPLIFQDGERCSDSPAFSILPNDTILESSEKAGNQKSVGARQRKI